MTNGLQSPRIEEATRSLESSKLPFDEISARAGYADTSFLRRMFKKNTGLTLGQYRRMFEPLAERSSSGGLLSKNEHWA